MLIVRPIKDSDRQAFIDMVFQVSAGMTNLPKNEETLVEKIAESQKSFAKSKGFPNKEIYIFLLEDTKNNEIAGTCAIWLKVGVNRNDQYYKVESLTTSSPWKEVPKEIKILQLYSPKTNVTEVGALYLKKNYCHHGLGPLLSLSRFLFMAAHKERFFSNIIAEIRGVTNSNNESPFWKDMGRHFCDISYQELMHRLGINASEATTVLPTHPVYLSFLSDEAKNAIGGVRDATLPAFHMLLEEGFSKSGEIDLFDAGPLLMAKLTSIKTIQESHITQLEHSVPSLDNEEIYLLSNERLEFRACYGKLKKGSYDKTILEEETAKILGLRPGDTFRCLLKTV